MTTSSAAHTAPSTTTVPPGAWRALLLVTLCVGLGVTARALLSRLGHVCVPPWLSAEAAPIVAIPLLAGSLGRILMGGRGCRFGGHLMYPLVSLITVIPVLPLAFVGDY